MNRSELEALEKTIQDAKHQNLQKLNLSYTQITALPEGVGQLSSLQSLDLSDTQIAVLPDGIGQLFNLKRLDLCNCRLKSIPYSVVKLGLPFIIDDECPASKKYINLTDVTLNEDDLSLFAQPQDTIEAYYQHHAKAVKEGKATFPSNGATDKNLLDECMRQDNMMCYSLPTDSTKMILSPTISVNISPTISPVISPPVSSTASTSSAADDDEKTSDEKDLERRKLEEEIKNLRLKNVATMSAAAILLMFLLALAITRPDSLFDLFPQVLEFVQGLFG